MTDVLSQGPLATPIRLLLAHGAGAPMTSPFWRRSLGCSLERGWRCPRNSSSPTWRRGGKGGEARPPPKAERLSTSTRRRRRPCAEAAARGQLLIGGKSMGGRVASLVADELYGDEAHRRPRSASAIPSIRRKTRAAAHGAPGASAHCPALIVQGERDPFGSRAEVEGYGLSPTIRFAWAGDGDHDLGRAAAAASPARATSPPPPTRSRHSRRRCRRTNRKGPRRSREPLQFMRGRARPQSLSFFFLSTALSPILPLMLAMPSLKMPSMVDARVLVVLPSAAS